MRSGPFLAFNKEWFNKHQKILVWLLNAPLVKYWFRFVMRIRSVDCPSNIKINRIEPNSFFFGAERKGDKIFLKTDFRTHWKYSKRIYFAFKYFWWMLHFWDALLADRFIPRWSFGFLTLTVYPDANPESTSVDGWCRFSSVEATWPTLVGGAGSDANDSADPSIVWDTQESPTTDRWGQIVRSFFLFDTSALTASATISNAVLSLRGTSKADNSAITPDLNIYSSAPASNTALVGGDYDSIGSTAFSTAITYASYSTTGYNDFTLNASGISNISKTSISKFGARNASYDAANVAPTWANNTGQNRLNANFADAAGTTTDPKLVITYTLPVTARNISNLLLMGV